MEQLRSPLSFVVLALLYETPLHPYAMGQRIRERGKDRVVNVAQRNSVQQTVKRLARDELIEPDARGADGNYPARIVYRITASGTDLLFRWLDEMLAAPADEYPRFPAALAFLALTDPVTTATLLERRHDALTARREELATSLDVAAGRLSRILLLEDEYALAMVDAELAWLSATLVELRTGTLDWNTDTLVATNGRPAATSQLE